MIKHIPPQNETMVSHMASPDCPCHPVRRAAAVQRTTGRYGRHQGYKSNVVYQHNPLTETVHS